ncbi:MAG: phosphopentomutase [Pseudomonadota bacterium]
MTRAFLVVLDSVGVGGAPDAADFGDAGSNTLVHIAQACAAGRAEDGRTGPLHLPNMAAMGLGEAARIASDIDPDLGPARTGAWGAATEVSPGKDTPSGHWELAGLPVPWDWHYFPDTEPAFPDDVMAAAAKAAGTDGTLGNCHASGTEIIARLGAEHMRTGWPICYTSADSVFQIAAHEESFGLDRLLALCEAVAPMLHDMKVGRVIARPFIGTDGTFERTKNRRDFAILPPADTLCDLARKAGRPVHAVGKIGDIFSMRGITDVTKGADEKLFEDLIALADTAEDGALVFANFVEFDSLYGHRRDVSGYARALEWFDAQLPRLRAALRDGDLLILTADHGNDPTWHGTDHTRERVPVLIDAPGMGLHGPLGVIGFVDVAATVAKHLGLPAQGPGRAVI